MKTKKLVPSAWCLVLSAALCAVGLTAFAENAAKLTNGETTTYYAEDGLYQLLVVDGLRDGDKLEFLKDVKVQDDSYNDYYSFTDGSTIKATVGKDGTAWDIDIAGQNAEIDDFVGTTADLSKKNYSFNDEGAYVRLYASSVAGAFVASVVEVHEEIEVTGVMKVEDLTFDPLETITLKGKGCVYTKNSKLKEFILDQFDEPVEAKDASSILGEGWYVYALDDDPPLPPLPPVTVDALSNVFALDLTAGDRIAADEETLVVDPAWGKATTAWVKLQNGWQRTYTCASNDLWDTTALEPGRHALAFYASADAFYGAFFWKTGDDWVVFDSSNITADVTFEAGKTYLFFGTNTVDATLTVTDGAKFEYDKVAPAGFLGGTVNLPKRYEQKTDGELYQIVEKIKGCEDNPWVVGNDGETPSPHYVEAYTNGTELVIGGEGAVTNLADIAKEVRDGIAAITITKATVTGAAKDAFKGVGGESEVKVTLPDGWQGELPDKDGKLYGMKVDMTNFTYPTAVKNVEFLQRYPWNGLVDIACDLSGEGEVTLTVTVLTNGVTLVAKPTITGETTIDVGAAGGAMEGVRLIWNAANDLPAGFKANGVKVKVTVEKAPSPEPPPAGQLWANGPIWTEANLGTSEVQGHPEYGALYTFDNATNEVAQLKDGSRLPTKEEFEKLIDTSVCDQQWDATRKGYLFTGKGDYAANSIFVPAAGFDTGSGFRMSAESTGICWSSTLDPTDTGCAYALDFSNGETEVHSRYECSLGLSVRTVKDAE